MIGDFISDMMLKIVNNWNRENRVLCTICLFVCLFSSHSRIFHSYGDVTIDGEGLQILTFAPHLWPLSSKSS